jgi:hypothetical protein
VGHTGFGLLFSNLFGGTLKSLYLRHVLPQLGSGFSSFCMARASIRSVGLTRAMPPDAHCQQPCLLSLPDLNGCCPHHTVRKSLTKAFS